MRKKKTYLAEELSICVLESRTNHPPLRVPYGIILFFNMIFKSQKVGPLLMVHTPRKKNQYPQARMVDAALKALEQTASGRAFLESLFGGKLDVEDFESLAASRQFLREIRKAMPHRSRQGVPSRRTIIHVHGERLHRHESGRERAHRLGTDRRNAAFQAARKRRIKAENMAQVLSEEGAPQLLLASVAANEIAEEPQEVTIRDDGSSEQYTGGQITGEWHTLSLSKEQALVVQRIRIGMVHTSLSNHSLIGIKWGRPGGALTQGHASPGLRTTVATPANPQQWMFEHSDYVFAWATQYGGAPDPTFQEIDLKPNFAVCRSYTVYVFTATTDNLNWNVRLYSQVVGITYPGILAVGR